MKAAASNRPLLAQPGFQRPYEPTKSHCVSPACTRQKFPRGWWFMPVVRNDHLTINCAEAIKVSKNIGL
jgi:hypothetical protein